MAMKNTVQSERQQMTIWRMHIACWIAKATNTVTDYVIIIAFPLQQLLRERASLLLYAHCLPFSYLHPLWCLFTAGNLRM